MPKAAIIVPLALIASLFPLKAFQYYWQSLPDWAIACIFRRLDDPSFYAMLAVTGAGLFVTRALKVTRSPIRITAWFWWTFSCCVGIYLTHVFLARETFFFWLKDEPFWASVAQLVEGIIVLSFILWGAAVSDQSWQLARWLRRQRSRRGRMRVAATLIASAGLVPLMAAAIALEVLNAVKQPLVTFSVRTIEFWFPHMGPINVRPDWAEETPLALVVASSLIFSASSLVVSAIAVWYLRAQYAFRLRIRKPLFVLRAVPRPHTAFPHLWYNAGRLRRLFTAAMTRVPRPLKVSLRHGRRAYVTGGVVRIIDRCLDIRIDRTRDSASGGGRVVTACGDHNPSLSIPVERSSREQGRHPRWRLRTSLKIKWLPLTAATILSLRRVADECRGLWCFDSRLR